jgi:hypothetical protein
MHTPILNNPVIRITTLGIKRKYIVLQFMSIFNITVDPSLTLNNNTLDR